ncbi:MAG TPA: ABC transporter permease, partial [Desulfobulbaceae bacterium]|nr:ABC transporter permease [Desulfobulbaceae bacterium]
MADSLAVLIIVSTIASGIRLATPFLLASLGEALGQRSGVLNLGVDGVMLLGAFGAYYTVLQTNNPYYGLLVGIGIGLLLGLFYGFITLNLQAEQGVSGIGIYLFGLGMSDLLFQKFVGTPRPILPFMPLHFPVLSDLPVGGEMLFQHSIIVYIAFGLVPVMSFVLNKTTYGLNVRAIGENPEAADSLGVSVMATRYSAIIIGNGLAGLA